MTRKQTDDSSSWEIRVPNALYLPVYTPFFYDPI